MDYQKRIQNPVTQLIFTCLKSTIETLEICSKLTLKTLERREICSKLTLKTPERRPSVFVVNFKHSSHLFLVFLLLTLNKEILAGQTSVLDRWRFYWLSINPFHAAGLFRSFVKTSENFWFSVVFREYRKRPVAWNRLINLI